MADPLDPNDPFLADYAQQPGMGAQQPGAGGGVEEQIMKMMRRQKIIDMMMGQGGQASQPQPSGGRFTVPTSPFAVLGDIAQSGAKGYMKSGGGGWW